MPNIHPTACVAPSARIADDVTIGPYCVVGGNVAIESGCELIAHVHLTGHTSVGARTRIFPFASLGTPPQSVNYRGGPTRLVIGADCEIRESVTMNTGTEDGGGVTEIGDRGLFMVGSHIAHDCRIGNDVIFANAAMVGGHCLVGDFVFFGAYAGAHQFSRIGAHAMVGGAAGVRQDIIPFALAAGAKARLVGVNLVGMKRRKFSSESISAVRAAYRMLFRGDGPFQPRVDRLEGELGHDVAVAQIITFVRSAHDRPLCHPGRQREV
jgi:UDP-N-acetylglucosamine acyltransferase